MFAWLVFGSFFLADANAKWYWWLLWSLGAVLDYMADRRDKRKGTLL